MPLGFAVGARFPHAGGGGPDARLEGDVHGLVSPRGGGGGRQWPVFPTRVGVNRPAGRARRPARGFPHAGGGDPSGTLSPDLARGFPHAGGGEPARVLIVDDDELFSPRGWG